MELGGLAQMYLVRVVELLLAYRNCSVQPLRERAERSHLKYKQSIVLSMESPPERFGGWVGAWLAGGCGCTSEYTMWW